MKSREMRTVVEFAPRECNKEADLLAKGSTELFDPSMRLEVAAGLSLGLFYLKLWRLDEKQSVRFER